MMKSFESLCFLLLIGTTAFVFLGHLSERDAISNPGTVSIGSNARKPTIKGRKLKDNINPPSPIYKNVGHIGLEDYRPIDPVPSSKASIRPKPIQHGSPLMPYIPKPPPRGKPKHGT